ncbi:hypothetical protein L9F63_014851 [Diploptera punctata]|uniref:Uncharacterized protein n=1 Tax=Diploptera punctata TaxID=6984 RepID=A0AAD8A8B4_DIPPU|nr:hypothetical protein L9F63_014851 [Diploptera punctata]
MSDIMPAYWTEKVNPQPGGDLHGSEGYSSNGSIPRDINHTSDRSSCSNSIQSASPPSRQSPISTPTGSRSPVPASPTIRKRGLQKALSSNHVSLNSVKQRLIRVSSTHSLSRPTSPLACHQKEKGILERIFGWYPILILKFIQHLISNVAYLTWSQLILLGPALWVSASLWIFWKCIQLPLTFVKCLLMIVCTPASERNRKKRTVLITGGSTIQALHLARNFYSAGARVVVCEVEGLFGLARFSTAVNKFYTVPKPDAEHPQNYVKALCDIVETEHVTYFIPVSSTSTAYYDALAKPHLELHGCICFCPNVKEVWILDDILEVMQQCQVVGIQTPIYHSVSSRDDITRLYNSGMLRTGRYFMVSVGPWGCRDKLKLALPAHRHEFKFSHEISEQRPWVIIQDLPGEQFLTCTTVKESQVVANVTCRVDKVTGGLVPIENQDITSWLMHFFSKLRSLRHVTGHLSFRFVLGDAGKIIIPMGCRVGVTLPYICYTSVHPRIVWKPCKHFSRQNSGPLVADAGRYWMHEAVMNTLKNPSVESVSRFIGTVLDKREVLFVYWDPLPYFAYYHLQLPFRNVLAFVQEHYVQNGRNGLYRTMAAPVH